MLVVAYWYHLSERQVEEITPYPLAIKEFVGLAVDELAPDHSTLSVCKRRLLAHDEEIGVGATIYAGDKAYDDTDLHDRLWAGGKGSALRLKEDRTRVRNEHHAFWREVVASPAYRAGQAERFKVERKYGEAKRWHGLGRCRYLGLWRYGIQAYLTALVLNLKRIVALLRGVRFRAGSRRWQRVVA